MSEHRILLIENPARLSVDLGRIKISREGEKDLFVLPSDVVVVLLHHHSIELTAQALRLLVESRAIMLVTDQQHHPSGWLTPLYGLPQASLRLHQQLRLSEELRQRLWKQLVQARIRTEAGNLRALELKGALRLERMVEDVQPGDTSHHEGQAAKHYWDCLFGIDFKRDKQGAEDALNAALNYGYAVLRSLVARELAVASLVPMLGVGHSSRDNPFNLADDFIEPYRAVVERQVYELHNEFGAFDKRARMSVLGFLKQTVKLGKQEFRLPPAIRETIASYVRILDTGTGSLLLPG